MGSDLRSTEARCARGGVPAAAGRSLLAGLLLSGWASISYAQSEPQPAAAGGAAPTTSTTGPLVLDPMVVTAVGTKTATSVEEVPQSVSVISRQELDQRGVQDFNGAVAYTPGIRVVDYPGGQGAPDIYLRGFRTINFLGLYKDGLRGGFNNYDALVEPYGVESVEVLRGPASVLYGQGQPGGLVNLTSKRPTEMPQHEIQLQGGNFDRFQGALDFSGPLDDKGQWLYRLTALGRSSGTQVWNSADDRTYVAPAFTWRPSEDTSLTVLASYLYNKAGGSEQSFPYYGTVGPNRNGRIKRDLFLGEADFNSAEIENTSVGYQFDHRFNEMFKFTSNFRYMHTSSDYELTYADDVDAFGRDSDTVGRVAQARNQSSDQILADNNLEMRFDTGPLEHTMLLGVDYGTYKRNETRNAGMMSPLNLYRPRYNGQITWLPRPVVNASYQLEQTGIYFQDQIRLDDWVLTGGLRQDWTTSITNNRLAGRKTTQDDDALTGRIGLLYTFDFGLSPYFSYSTSFVPSVGSLRADGEPFKPTEGEQYEAGVKYQPPGLNSYVTLAFFDITQTNVLTPDPKNTGYYVQSGEVRSRGVELEGKANLMDGLDLILSYTYTDAEVTKDNPDAAGVSRKGNRMPTVPEHMASGWLDYTVQSGSLKGLGLGAGVRYVGPSYDATNEFKTDGYTLVDAAIRYDLGNADPRLQGATIAINAANLFDTRYYTPGFSPGLVFAGNERTVYGTLTYRW